MPLRDGDPSRIGRFRLTARLGAGGMGVVYLGAAKDGTQAAIKVLRPELADNQEFRVRFRREVAVMARVAGLCTVRVIEAGTESATPFLATEYADGPSLAEYVRLTGRSARTCSWAWRRVSPRHSPRSTRPGWFTATLSPATCCSRLRGRRSSTSESRRPWTQRPLRRPA
jgi:serine/threonine protein kinase